MTRQWLFCGIVAVTLATASLGAGQGGTASAFARMAKLRNPAALNEQAPATYRVNIETSKGPFTVAVTRAWAPIGADRFYNLVKAGFYDDVRFFRVLPAYIAQFGMHGIPNVESTWRRQTLKDDRLTQSNKRGFVSFASAGPNSRTTQVFVNMAENGAKLDHLGFVPIGQVTPAAGMAVVDQLFSGYTDQPDQDRLRTEGNGYLTRSFPKLDYIKTATLAQ